MKRIRRRHTKEFKRQAVALMDDDEKSNVQLAKELGLDISLLYKWRRALEKDGERAFPGQGNQAQPTDENDELARLRREVAQLRKERDFLRSAAAYFAKELPPE